jgi:hypothetical protein
MLSRRSAINIETAGNAHPSKHRLATIPQVPAQITAKDYIALRGHVCGNF